jgi:hypothetical protein
VIHLLLMAIDFSTLNHVKTAVSVNEQEQVVEDLIVRLIGARASEFSITVNTSIGPPDKDTFKVRLAGRKLL